MKSKKAGNIIMWVICVSIVLAGFAIIASQKVTIGYSHLNYSKYIKVGEYKGLKANENKVKVTKQDIKDEIQSRVDAETTTKKVTKGKVKKGDTVLIDYEGKIDGEKFLGGSADDYELEIGSNSFIKGFEKGLIGKDIGSTVDLNLTFPKDYDNEQVAGKDVVFTVNIKAKQKEIKYEYNEEFLKKFTKCKTKDEYKAYIKKELKKKKKEEAENDVKETLFSEISEKTKVKKTPKKLYQAEKESVEENYNQTASMYGMSLEDLATQMYGSTEKEFKKRMKDEAKENVKKNMIAYYIAKKEGIKVSTDDAVKWLKKELKENDMTVKDFEKNTGMTMKKYIKEHNVKDDVIMEKAKDVIYDSAKITKVKAEEPTESETQS